MTYHVIWVGLTHDGQRARSSVTCKCDVLPEDLGVVIDGQLGGRVEGADGVRHIGADAGHEVLFAVVGGRELVAACRVNARSTSVVIWIWLP